MVSNKTNRTIKNRFLRKHGYTIRGASLEINRITGSNFSAGQISRADPSVIREINKINKGLFKRRTRRASTVNPLGKKIARRERKKPKLGKKRERGVGKLGAATSVCLFYKAALGKADMVQGDHSFSFRYKGSARRPNQQGLRSSARRSHRIFENPDHIFRRWVKVELI